MTALPGNKRINWVSYRPVEDHPHRGGRGEENGVEGHGTREGKPCGNES